ncbi:hypothetical protein JTE90_012980, partial [Oedothorax gibbosus]
QSVEKVRATIEWGLPPLDSSTRRGVLAPLTPALYCLCCGPHVGYSCRRIASASQDHLLVELERARASSLPPPGPPGHLDAAVGEDAPLPTTCSIAVGDDFQALWTPPALCGRCLGDDSPPRIILLVDDSERGLQSLASRAKAAADALEISPVSPISPPLNATDDSSPRPRHSWSSRDSGRGSSAPPSLHDELSASGTSHLLSSTINSRRSSRSSLKRVSFGADVVIHGPPSPLGPPPPPVHSARRRVIVFGLSELSSASSICDALLGLPSCPPGPLDVVRFFYGRDGSRNCILSADSLICDFLDGFPRISIDHLRVRVRRFIFIGRCFNCHHLDHLAKDCSLPPACGICGGTHRSSGCCDPPRCLLCPSNNAHRSDSPTCPTLLAYKKSKLAAHVRSTSLRQGPPSPPVRRSVTVRLPLDRILPGSSPGPRPPGHTRADFPMAPASTSMVTLPAPPPASQERLPLMYYSDGSSCRSSQDDDADPSCSDEDVYDQYDLAPW